MRDALNGRLSGRPFLFAELSLMGDNRGMSDTGVRIRKWGRDWQQLQAEKALIEDAVKGDDFDEAFERMLKIDRVREDFRKRTRKPRE